MSSFLNPISNVIIKLLNGANSSQFVFWLSIILLAFSAGALIYYNINMRD